MQKILGLVVVVGFVVAAPRAAEAQEWKNIVGLQLGYGYTQSIYTPTQVTTAVKGERFRMIVPHSCGAVQVYQFALYGKTIGGQRVLIGAQAISAEQDLQAGVNKFTYLLNGGTAATVYEVGLYAYVPNLAGCVIGFQQKNTPVAEPDSCDLSYACTQIADGARSCTATPKDGSAGVFVQWGNPAGDNECNIQKQLKAQICGQGKDPDDYTLQCVFEHE